jgi:starvation-inducible outer membrane lipoprotein
MKYLFILLALLLTGCQAVSLQVEKSESLREYLKECKESKPDFSDFDKYSRP